MRNWEDKHMVRATLNEWQKGYLWGFIWGTASCLFLFVT